MWCDQGPISQNLSVKEFFKNEIFKPVFDDTKIEYAEDAILLKNLVSEFEKIEIKLDTIDMYCIFTKLKILDEYEAISVNILEKLKISDFYFWIYLIR